MLLEPNLRLETWKYKLFLQVVDTNESLRVFLFAQKLCPDGDIVPLLEYYSTKTSSISESYDYKILLFIEYQWYTPR